MACEKIDYYGSCVYCPECQISDGNCAGNTNHLVDLMTCVDRERPDLKITGKWGRKAKDGVYMVRNGKVREIEAFEDNVLESLKI